MPPQINPINLKEEMFQSNFKNSLRKLIRKLNQQNAKMTRVTIKAGLRILEISSVNPAALFHLPLLLGLRTYKYSDSLLIQNQILREKSTQHKKTKIFLSHHLIYN